MYKGFPIIGRYEVQSRHEVSGTVIAHNNVGFNSEVMGDTLHLIKLRLYFWARSCMGNWNRQLSMTLIYNKVLVGVYSCMELKAHFVFSFLC